MFVLDFHKNHFVKKIIFEFKIKSYFQLILSKSIFLKTWIMRLFSKIIFIIVNKHKTTLNFFQNFYKCTLYGMDLFQLNQSSWDRNLIWECNSFKLSWGKALSTLYSFIWHKRLISTILHRKNPIQTNKKKILMLIKLLTHYVTKKTSCPLF